MNILVIGDPNSAYIEGYIKHVLLGNKIVIASDVRMNENYRIFYESNNISYLWFNNKFIKRIPGIRSEIGARIHGAKLKKTYGEFDYIHIHGLNRYRGILALSAKSKTTKIVITVWGSELLRSDNKRLASYLKFYKAASAISFENKEMMDKFKDRYGKIKNAKYLLTRFGDELLDVMRKQSDNHLNILNKQKNEIVISVGYNRNPAHRHIEVIEQITTLPYDIQKRIVLLLVMTYGPVNENYLSQLEKLLNSFQGRVIKFEKYLKREELAAIISEADVFIHAQPTDAQSMTIMEYLFTKSIVLNGRWLDYSIIRENDITYYLYDTFDELPALVLDIINNLSNYRNAVEENPQKIEKLFSWNEVKKQWLEMYSD